MDKTIGGGTGDTFIRDKKMETIGETKTSAQLPFPLFGVASKGYICINPLGCLGVNIMYQNMLKMCEYETEESSPAYK